MWACVVGHFHDGGCVWRAIGAVTEIDTASGWHLACYTFSSKRQRLHSKNHLQRWIKPAPQAATSTTRLLQCCCAASWVYQVPGTFYDLVVQHFMLASSFGANSSSNYGQGGRLSLSYKTPIHNHGNGPYLARSSGSERCPSRGGGAASGPARTAPCSGLVSRHPPHEQGLPGLYNYFLPLQCGAVFYEASPVSCFSSSQRCFKHSTSEG